MKKGYFILFIFLFASFSFAKKVATLPELNNPFGLHIDVDGIFITEGVTIYIYSSKDYSLIKKFGREGEGPGEILLRRRGGSTEIGLIVENDHIIATSVSKSVYFTKNGQFIKEIRVPSIGRIAVPLDNLFVTQNYIREEDQTLYHGVVIYDSNFKEIKEIYRHEHGIQWRRGWNIAKPFNPLTIIPVNFEICDKKIFVIPGDRSNVLVFNKEGKEIFSITNKDELLKFMERDKKKIVDDYKHIPVLDRAYQTNKKLFKFPKYFPPIHWFYIDPVERKVYLETEKRENDKAKHIVFDFTGKLLEKIMIPYQGILKIYNGKLYQLIENEDEEEWELHITEIR